MKIINLKTTHYAYAGGITLSLYAKRYVEATEANLKLFAGMIEGGYLEVVEFEDFEKKYINKKNSQVTTKENFIKNEVVEPLINEEKIENAEENTEEKNDDAVDYSELSKKQICEILDEKKIEYDSRLNKEKLIALLA